MSYELVEILREVGCPRLLVVGDLILDRYTWADAERISQEAPVMLLREDHREVRLGGAGNVANMLRGLDARVTMAGVIGDDEDGREMQHQLALAGVETELVVTDSTRPTTVKTRVIGRAQHRHPHQVLRVDRESRDPLNGVIETRLVEALVNEIQHVDAVLVSDYAKGVCTPGLLAAVIAAGRQAGVPVIVDPASAADYAQYRRATAITPNRGETGRATARTIQTVEAGLAAAELLRKQLALDAAFVTLDSDGIALATDGEPGRHVPTRRREVYDITGAGDMVLATIGLVAAAGGSAEIMARLANIAGGLEVEKIGVVTISRAEMIADLLGGPRSAKEKIHDLESLVALVSARREAGQRVVMTNGCFDLFHAGHVACLEQAAAEGDCLVVAINSDQSVRGLGKAPGRPIMPQEQRGALLAALEVVDFVVVFDESTPLATIEALRPDVLVKGGTYTQAEIVGRDLVESYGGVAKPLGLVPGLSTTEIIARIRELEETPEQPWRQAG
ncbi:MAG: bifunctional heptose 7-phosphate kinase/heptose 1-phosphate adenyltransferase [Planctomyces sp.]|jgi:D-beta-D-heptose 7-phosphate kinase/D-beta-D-heptose 1-phosphate adenosyltransferase|nr:bifunctional heptose 7-phosphate kinase/heptose 1-phosphate adenyltransferase [Planctomyces sp.]